MTETINFHDFMKRDYKKLRKIDYKVLSLIPTGSLFTLSPMVAKAYAVVLGMGVVLIIAAQFEMLMANRGYTGIAASIIDFFKMVLPIAFIAALVFFIATNPLL